MTNSYTDLGKKDRLSNASGYGQWCSDESCLESQKTGWQSSNDSRAKAPGLSTGRCDAPFYGWCWSGQGTQVLENHTFNYILPGYNLDLNGRAADLYIRSTTTSINGAHEFTVALSTTIKDSSHPPVLVEGTQPKEELKALKDYNADTRKKLTELFEGMISNWIKIG